MKWLRGWLLRLGGIFGRQRQERDLATELESHLQMHIEDNLRAGMNAREARREALMRLGGVEQTKEIYRDRRELPRLETLFQDLRFAFRMLRKTPGFTAVASLTLALGIGANTAIFSIVNAVVLRPLPYKDSPRIVTFHTKTAMFPNFTLPLTWPAFYEVRSQATLLEEMAAYWATDRTLTGVEQPEVLRVTGVTSGFFEELGERVQQGRLLAERDHQAGQDRVAVISDALWRTRFRRDPAVIGRQLILDKEIYTIIGVAANGFAFPEKSEVWLPLSLTPEIERNQKFFRFQAFGKLRKGEKLETLQAELGTIGQRIVKEDPSLSAGYRLSAEPLLESSVQDARQGYLVLLAAATFVLLIACANLTSLLMARSWGRQREMAVRAALGASPGRLQRQGLVESCLLALLGGAVGIALAAGVVQVFRAIAPSGTPRLAEISADWTLLWFALGSSLVSGVVFGLAPARRAARMDPNDALKEGTGGSVKGTSRFGNALVVVEVALAFILLIGSTLMMQTLAHLLHQNPGFRTDHLLTFDLPQPSQRSRKDSEERAAGQIARLKDMLAQVRRLPGVEEVVASDHGMLDGMYFEHSGLKLEGALPQYSAPAEGLIERYISPGYFRMMGISLVRGREFEEQDQRGTHRVVMVNEAMARKFWGTLDVVGKRIGVSTDGKGTLEWNEVVGVGSNVRDVGIQEEAGPEYFLALFQWGVGSHHLFVRTQANPDALAGTISRQIWASYPDQPLRHVMTLTKTIAESVGDQRMHTVLLGVFAGVGLALALLGVYGVVSYSVARRTQEIGVRMALGAGRADVLRMVLRQGLTLVACGAAIGAAGALGAVRVIASELYGVKSGDPWTFSASAALILIVGSLACWIPARRAMRVDPMVALRYE
ncbi:MAG TPA: ABC transporter permease [Candidatus Limnocylindria bacterium]|jgi:putative ABC transport system permease protein|nr:ABC transporter permease [Candidatus Limnocylindria bacterium]